MTRQGSPSAWLTGGLPLTPLAVFVVLLLIPFADSGVWQNLLFLLATVMGIMIVRANNVSVMMGFYQLQTLVLFILVGSLAYSNADSRSLLYLVMLFPLFRWALLPAWFTFASGVVVSDQDVLPLVTIYKKLWGLLAASRPNASVMLGLAAVCATSSWWALPKYSHYSAQVLGVVISFPQILGVAVSLLSFFIYLAARRLQTKLLAHPDTEPNRARSAAYEQQHGFSNLSALFSIIAVVLTLLSYGFAFKRFTGQAGDLARLNGIGSAIALTLLGLLIMSVKDDLLSFFQGLLTAENGPVVAAVTLAPPADLGAILFALFVFTIGTMIIGIALIRQVQPKSLDIKDHKLLLEKREV